MGCTYSQKNLGTGHIIPVFKLFKICKHLFHSVQLVYQTKFQGEGQCRKQNQVRREEGLQGPEHSEHSLP